jgi:hypothetical protein
VYTTGGRSGGWIFTPIPAKVCDSRVGKMKISNLARNLFFAGLLGGAAFGAWWMGRGGQPLFQGEDPGSGRGAASLTELREEVEGAVVYEHRGGIYKTVIGGKKGILLAEMGTCPRWSPDGRHVAFLRGGYLMRMNAAGGEAEVLLAVKDPRALAYHPNNREIFFTDGRAVKSYALADREVRTVVKGLRCLEIDVAAGGARLVATVKKISFRIYAFDLRTGRKRKLAAGCSASLSPDGGTVTRNDRSHRRLSLLSWVGGRETGALSAPAGLTFDNQFWSNSRDWIASRSEGAYEDIFIHRVSSGKAYRVTFSGDCDRPDLFVHPR